jgi:methionyl-tRNA formyltransferase
MDVAIIGRGNTLYHSARALVEAGHSISIIVTSTPSQHHQRSVSDYRKLSTELGAEFRQTTDINDDEIINKFRQLDCKLAVSANWKTRIKPIVFESFEHGVINSHAGDLPRYRGNAATNWAIIADEKKIVFTIHYMNEEIDAGPILLQRQYPIKQSTTIGDILEFAAENVPEMFCEAVNGIEQGTIEPTPQPEDASELLYCYPRIPKDSELDWSDSADKLDRIIRASSEPLFGAFTYLGDDKLRIWKAYVEHPDFSYHGVPGQVAELRPEAGEVAVITGDGFLVLEEVQKEGEDRQPATDVIKSIRTRLGLDVSKELRQLRDRVLTLEKRLQEN